MNGRLAKRDGIAGRGSRPPISADGVVGLVVLAGALWLYWAAGDLPRPSLVPIGPGFYPRMLFVVTALLGAALLVSDLLAARRPAPAPGYYRLVLVTFVIFTGYVLALAPLGYRVATFLFVGVLQAVLEPPRGRRWLLVPAVALATTAITYYVFEGYLSVLLPRGRLTGF